MTSPIGQVHSLSDHIGDAENHLPSIEEYAYPRVACSATCKGDKKNTSHFFWDFQLGSVIPLFYYRSGEMCNLFEPNDKEFELL